MNKNCKACSVEFIAQNLSALYCPEHKFIKSICSVCNKSFQYKDHRERPRYTCSIKCHGIRISKLKRKKSVCRQCNMEFEFKKGEKVKYYCNIKCYGISQRLNDDQKFEKMKSDFERYVIKNNDGCWGWSGTLTNKGYGQIRMGSLKPNRIDAHRASWLIHNGSIADGLFVCHVCDVRTCTAPNHLFLGTQKDNIRDMLKKGRGAGHFPKGHIPHNKKPVNK
jgi:hypothetical protein